MQRARGREGKVESSSSSVPPFPPLSPVLQHASHHDRSSEQAPVPFAASTLPSGSSISQISQRDARPASFAMKEKGPHAGVLALSLFDLPAHDQTAIPR